MKAYSIFDDYTEEAKAILSEAGVKVTIHPSGVHRPDHEQMKIILSTYRIDSSKIDICIWQNPISSYIPEDLMGHGGDGPLRAMDYKNKIRRMLSLADADMPVPSSSSEAH